ncbi:MAG: PspC domain-containing protein [Candidatus Cloacimonetes bacterium]|nr:PspC domain-containing protein [Candidatus Cloacimonadota bacterium]
MKKLHLSMQNRKIAGVCGGLGESTGIDSDIVRAVFLISILAGGMGFLLYLILWVILPEMDFGEEVIKSSIFTNLRRSNSEKIVAGICGGIARYLDWDVSVIRILLIVIVLTGGVGIPVYIVLWILMPKEEEAE